MSGSQTQLTPDQSIAAGNPQPQTTVQTSAGPFIRHSQPGRRAMYTVNPVFGGQVTQPLVSAPGYARSLRLLFQGTGGAGTGVTSAADAPFNIAALVTFKDAFGTSLIVAPGYEAFNLIPMFGGGFGRQATRNVANLPSWSAIAAGSGNFQFATQLPYEFVKGYGVVSLANASLLPTLTLNMNTSTAFYGATSPTTLPTLSLVNDADFYWLPEGVNVTPPGIGTTRQWFYQQCNPPIGSGSASTPVLPRMGGYLDTIILEIRDSTGARVGSVSTVWPSRFRFVVDNVALFDSDIRHFFDDMAIVYEGVTIPTGVVSISRKTSLSQIDEGLFDTGETYLSTNPGTSIEVPGMPWGTITNSPATLNALVGQVVPKGTLIQGLPSI
jgi:hypothetical protein